MQARSLPGFLSEAAQNAFLVPFAPCQNCESQNRYVTTYIFAL